MLIKSLKIRNLLSFGPETPELGLKQLNVLIGPNGSGKSNFMEAISLLQAAPRDLSAPVKDVGGVQDWLWKGTPRPVASIEATVKPPKGSMAIRHSLSFTEHGQRFELVDERVENEAAYPGKPDPYFFYRYQNGRPVLNERSSLGRSLRQGGLNQTEAEGEERPLKRETINPEQSILSQVKDPERYPELAHLDNSYSRIALFREWSFGRYTAPRHPQKADLRNDFLSPAGDNLALVLNKIRPKVKARLNEALTALYPAIEDFDVQVEAGRVHLFLMEGNLSIPATRLSDGTLRYLCLLAILCHPEPPPLICIEEPELGLHPDVLPQIAKLLVEASERTQLIVTTHSDSIVDALNDSPDSVVVCEKETDVTIMRRLEKERLGKWMEKYSLGRLWRMGELGGNRW